jgi:hypothetical protein
MKSTIIAAILGLAIGILGTLGLQKKTILDPAIIVQTDTVYQEVIKHDTIFNTKYVKQVDIRHDTLNIIKYISDSTAVAEITEDQYLFTNYDDQDTVQYKIWVTGYYPVVDSVEFAIKYPTITTIYEKPQPKSHLNHGIQLGVGYGLTGRKPDLFVGYGFTYSF